MVPILRRENTTVPNDRWRKDLIIQQMVPVSLLLAPFVSTRLFRDAAIASADCGDGPNMIARARNCYHGVDVLAAHVLGVSLVVRAADARR